MKENVEFGNGFEIGRKLSHDDELIQYLATKNGKKYRLFIILNNHEEIDSHINKFAKSENSDPLEIVDFGKTSDDNWFFVIPFHEWRSLRSILNEKEISEQRSMQLIAAIFAQLKTLHEQGISNFRLIPETIFILKDNRVVILPFIRFDHASVIDVISSDKVRNEVYYFSPEQLTNHLTEPISDFYVLGIIFYEILFNIVPFYDEQKIEVVKQHLESEPPKPVRIDSEGKYKLFNIIKKMLVKDPVQRHKIRGIIENEIGNLLKFHIVFWEKEHTDQDEIGDLPGQTFNEQLLRIGNKILKQIRQVNYFHGGYIGIKDDNTGYVEEMICFLKTELKKEKTNDIVYIPHKKMEMNWQGISEIVEMIVERVKWTSGEKYRSLMESGVVRLLSEKDYITTVYSEVLFNEEEIILHLLDFFEKVSLWSPFVLLIDRFAYFDDKSRKFIINMIDQSPDIPVLFIIFLTPELSIPQLQYDFSLSLLQKDEAIAMIRKEMQIPENEALLVYNRLVVKSGKNKSNFALFLHWLNDFPDKNLPVSVFDLLKQIVHHLDPVQINLLQELASWPVPPALAFFSNEEQENLKFLMNRKLIKFSNEKKETLSFAYPLLAKIIELHLPQKLKFNRIARNLTTLLEKRPWLWIDFIENVDDFNDKIKEMLFRAVSYFTRLDANMEAVKLLDTTVLHFPDYADVADILSRYYMIYLRLGSYGAALNYLTKLLQHTPHDIELMLHQLLLFVKMDYDAEAKELINEIDKQSKLSELEKAKLDSIIADMLNKGSQFQTAIRKYRTSREKFVKLGQIREAQDVLKKEINVLKELGPYEEIDTLLKTAKRYLETESNNDFAFWYYKQNGDFSMNRGHYIQAAEFYQSAFNMPDVSKSEAEYTDLLYNQAGLQWLIGDYTTSTKLYELVKERYKANDKNDKYIKSLDSLAVIYRETGRYGQALELQEEVLVLAENTRDMNLVMTANNNLGLLFLDMNQLQKSIQYFQKTQQFNKDTGNELERYRAFLGMASVAFKQGLHKDAGKFIQYAAELNDKHIGFFRNDLNYYYGKTAFFEENHDKSIEYANLFLASTRLSFKYQTYGKLLIAENYTARQQYDKAIKYVSEAFNLARIAGLEPMMQKILWLKSRIHWQIEEPDFAKSALEQTTLLIHKISNSFKSEVDRLIFMETLEFTPILEMHKNHFGES